jgi:hypothetical protein
MTPREVFEVPRDHEDEGLASTPRRRLFVASGLGLALGLVFGTIVVAWPKTVPQRPDPSPPYRAFSDTSYWNTPLPDSAPVDPNSESMIEFLRSSNRRDFIRLGGTDPTGRWGNPVYWAGPGDPSYDVSNSCRYPQPSEFRDVRIPLGAQPDPTSDAAMTVYDLQRGLVFAMHWSVYDAERDAWSACGGTVFSLGSNGLDGDWPGSDDPRNTGHRGVPPPTYAVRYDEVELGTIDHVLKIAVHTAAPSHVFPMVGSDGIATDPAAPPEGARIRIEPSLDLDELDLSPAALIVARALQTYGAVVGDQSGGSVALKVENTVAEGQGQRWTGVLAADSLSAIPLDAYQVVELGYQG